MTTLEPLSESELQHLQEQWLAGTRRELAPVRLHADGPLAEDWTEQPPFPESLLTGESNPYSRHTVDYVPYIPVMRSDEPDRRLWERLLIGAMALTACAWLLKFIVWVWHR